MRRGRLRPGFDRKPVGNDDCRSGIASGAEVVKGSGRLDTTPYSADIG
ncbi:hypothetical protein ACWDE0_13230 [Streptomyces sp. 900105755]